MIYRTSEKECYVHVIALVRVERLLGPGTSRKGPDHGNWRRKRTWETKKGGGSMPVACRAPLPARECLLEGFAGGEASPCDTLHKDQDLRTATFFTSSQFVLAADTGVKISDA